MLICYDMVFPEGTRCLALQGQTWFSIPRWAARPSATTRSAWPPFAPGQSDNFIYLSSPCAASGSMIISPQGKVLAATDEPDGLAIADIDPCGGREGGDAFNTQRDMRGRLFRERVPGLTASLPIPTRPCSPRCRRT